jgi:DNA-binding CsgD family transcriptional regulator
MAGSLFVGRGDELERLAGVIRGDSGSLSVAVVTGDAGIGKTRLLAEALRAAPDVLVLAGACLPLSESLPYGAVTDALARLTGSSARPTLDRALARCAPYVKSQLAALVPSLVEDPGAAMNAAVDRTRLLAAVRELLGALGAERRTALAVEDLHWADTGTLDLLTMLLSGMPPGTALVTTSRRDELPDADHARDWLAGIARLSGVEPVTLAPLPREDVQALVASLVDGEPAAAFVADVLRRGEGSPFFTEQLVAAARDVAPPLEVPAGVPAGVEQMLLSRVRSVGPAATAVAAALAVAARPLAEPELAACLGTSVDVALALRELLDAHLVAPAAEDRYRLRHALLEDTVSATLLASQRATLHAGVATVLAAREGESPAEVAAHWARAGNQAQEADWSVAAARHAESVFAWREASTAWLRVWELWEPLSADARPDIELTDAVIGCVVAAGRSDDGTFMHLAENALADHRVTTNDQATAQLLRLYGNRLMGSDVSAGLATLERAVLLFDRAGKPCAEQVRAFQRFVQAKTRSGLTTGNEAAEMARATAIAEQIGDKHVQLELASDRGVVQLEAGLVDDGLTDLLAVIHLAGEAGADLVDLVASNHLIDGYLWLLRLPEGIAAGRGGIERAVAHGYRESFGFSILVVNTVDCLLLRGERDSAVDLVASYLMPTITNAGWPLHMARAELDVCLADLNDALTLVERVQSLAHSRNAELMLWLAEVGSEANLWMGRSQAAWEQTEHGWPLIEGSTLACRSSRMLALAARAAADLAVVQPDVDAERLAAKLSERAARAQCFVAHPARVMGSAYGSTFDAELARLQRSGQESAWRADKQTWAGHDVPHRAAYAGWRLAENLVAAGRRKAAETELVEAYIAAESHVPLRREIAGLARRARLQLPAAEAALPPAPTAGASDATHGLTPRELAVLQLLGSGATNAEIGRRLYMSPKTASVHVSAILRKLGVSGRVQAATIAERMGLLAVDDETNRDC